MDVMCKYSLSQLSTWWIFKREETIISTLYCTEYFVIAIVDTGLSVTILHK